MKKLFFYLILIAIPLKAEKTKTVFNPYTGKFDFITALTTNSVVAGAGITTSCTSGACTITASGSSASNLEVLGNSVRVSSPTSTLSLIAGSNITLTTATVNGTTAQVTISASGSGSSVIQSSGIAFGSATNTVTSDTNTLIYAESSHVVHIGSNPYTGGSWDDSVYGQGLRLWSMQSALDANPLIILGPVTAAQNSFDDFQPFYIALGTNPFHPNASLEMNLYESGLTGITTTSGIEYFDSGSLSPTAEFSSSGGSIINGDITINGAVKLPLLPASEFLKTDGSQNIIAYDLLNSTQSWTGSNTFGYGLGASTAAVILNADDTYDALDMMIKPASGSYSRIGVFGGAGSPIKIGALEFSKNNTGQHYLGWDFQDATGTTTLNVNSFLVGAGAKTITAYGTFIAVSSTSLQGQVSVSSSVLLSGSAGSSGQVLTSGGAGTVPTWTSVTASAAGSNFQVQLSSAGGLGADSSLSFSTVTKALSVASVSVGTNTIPGGVLLYQLQSYGTNYAGIVANSSMTNTYAVQMPTYAPVAVGSVIAASNSLWTDPYGRIVSTGTWIVPPLAGACSANQFETADNANGAPTCAAVVTAANVSGSAAITGPVTFAQGTNVTLSQSGSTITINSSGSGSGVPSVNSSGNAAITSAVTLQAGTNVTLSQSGSTITINSSGGGGGITGTINAANQFSVPYYSIGGSSTALSAYPGVTFSTASVGITISTSAVYSGGYTQDFSADIIKNFAAIPQVSTTDVWSNGTTGNAAGSTTEEAFFSTVTLAAASTSGTLDGTHKSMYLFLGHDVVGNATPTIIRRLKACPVANWTGTSCSAGVSTLWTSNTANIATTTGVQEQEQWILSATQTAGTFKVNMAARTIGLLSQLPVGLSQAANCTACTGGSWVIFYTAQFSASATGTAVCGGVTTGGTNCISNENVINYFID